MGPKEIADSDIFAQILHSRKNLIDGVAKISRAKSAEEGGCGVVGFAADVLVQGRHILEPSVQMHNRGNGKGGGIACACLNNEQLGVDKTTLRDDNIIQIALLDPDARQEIEQQFIAPYFTIDHKTEVEPVADWTELGIPVRPPDVVRYFVRVKENELRKFAFEKSLPGLSYRDIVDEFIYQNSVQLNQRYYTSLGEKRAFVLSHARDLMIFKIVGYAEQVAKYYGLEDFQARIWIAHQRYPTKGRVWHPAGSHPFIGMNEALVHNGDFANYHGVSEYLRQHNIFPQFLTDTEVSVLLFDLWSRIYKYPLEYVIEAMAPTTELDFDHLSEDKQRIYRFIQAMHMHSSPDGPWFFIIAQSNPAKQIYNLLGITDTAMLRPQVFALQAGDVSIGLVASEKQAIDATLHSLSQADPRFRCIADLYWNARGGSHTDGGAFSFTLTQQNGRFSLSCTDKFGKTISTPSGEYRINTKAEPIAPSDRGKEIQEIETELTAGNSANSFKRLQSTLSAWNLDNFRWMIDRIVKKAAKDENREAGLALLTLLNDRRYDCAQMRRSSVLQLIRAAINKVLDSAPPISDTGIGRYKRVDWDSRDEIRVPKNHEETLIINGRDFPPEGDDCDARLVVKAYELGWKRFIVYGLRGQRFHGCGFGPETKDVRIDIYGSSGDYLASGIDGMEILVHDNGQDQLGQIMKSGRLVVYGDVGQAFMYGAKGGEVYIMGNAAGRPLINAVGKPRVVINGTCLDFLAESFMAGDPHKGGGFAVVNGLEFDDKGAIREQRTPYPGSNLFSLASGGAIFVRDPHKKLTNEQLNGGEFTDFTEKDWNLILPYLKKNEQFFDISVEKDLLSVNGLQRDPGEVYRSVRAIKLDVLSKVGVAE